MDNHLKFNCFYFEKQQHGIYRMICDDNVMVHEKGFQTELTWATSY